MGNDIESVFTRECENCEWLKNEKCKKAKRNNWPLNREDCYRNPDDWCKDFESKSHN